MLYKISKYLHEEINNGKLEWIKKLIPHSKILLASFFIVYIIGYIINNLCIDEIMKYLGLLILTVLFLMNFKSIDNIDSIFKYLLYFVLIMFVFFHLVVPYEVFEKCY